MMAKLRLAVRAYHVTVNLVLDMKGGTLSGVNGRHVPLAGFSAEVGMGSLHKRQTVTRWALVGPLAVVAPKKTQNATLTITGPGVAQVYEIEAKHITAAQQFAAQVNLLGSAQ